MGFYLPLTGMRHFATYILIFFAAALKCQDKLYFLDGTTKTGKVTEIGPEQIIIRSENENFQIPRSSLILIEFSNGSVEKLNTPEENVTAPKDKKENFHYKQPKADAYNYNRVSINTLALCNADIAAFYERKVSKKTGLGLMGAYNFNLNANATNAFIAVLANAKKKYDLGAFINFYPAPFEKRTYMHFGMMIKYTSFSYTSVKTDSTKVGTVVSVNTTYKAANGSQLATIFTIGSHTDITKNFFIRTIFGLGAFKLHGDYKEQYNIELNKSNQSNNGTNATPLHVNMLPKFYFGINLGFKL